MHAPERIVDALERRWRRVRLAWSQARRCWLLVMRGRLSGDLHILREIRGHPTVGNTLGWLKLNFVGDLRSSWRQDNFLNHLDGYRDRHEREEEAAFLDRTHHDATDRLIHALRRLPGVLGRG